MSIYTTQFRWIVERLQDQADVSRDDFSVCYSYLGLDSYPIFDESYRAQLNDKIIRHFYFREIGFETAAQFAWFLRRTMNENMPYFNQLYESESIIVDPITNRKYGWQEAYDLAQGGSTTSESSDSQTNGLNVVEHVDDDLTHGKKNVTETDKTFGKTTDDTSTTSYGRTQNTVNGGSDQVTEGGTHERVINEDTPMNLIPNGAIENLNYATEVTYTDREGTSAGVTAYGGTTAITNGGSDTITSSSEEGGTEGQETTSTDSGKDQRDIDTTRSESGTKSGSATTETTRDLDESGTRTHNVSGYDGIAPADLLMKWRETFLNIDMQVIASLETLFFGLWN